MSKEITVEELIANIAAHLDEVKNGETLTIVQDGKQIATMKPHLSWESVKYPFRDLKFTPLKKPLSVDPTDLIREDRDYEEKKHGF